MFGQYSSESRGRTNPLAGNSQARKQREKQVFDTSEIPHLWTHRTQYSARNAHGNFYFTGPTIFSYGSHFPIASHVENRKGQRAILFTTDTYSNTTASHIHAVRMAIPSSIQRFEVDLDGYMLPEDDGKLDATAYARIIASYQIEVKRLTDEAIASRTTAKIGRLLGSARLTVAELLRFVEFFGLPKLSAKARITSRKLPVVPASVDEAKELGRAAKQAAAKAAKAERERRAAEYKATIDKWMELHPDYAARWDGTTENAEALAAEFREVERKEKQLKWMAAFLADRIAGEWDGTIEHGEALKREYERADNNMQRETRQIRAQAAYDAWLSCRAVTSSGLYDFPTALRIVGNQVETSRGANFPVEHARRGLALVRAVMARGEEWRTNGHTCHLGHYRIDRITADGTVYAGCHVVPWSAIERIAPELDYWQPRNKADECSQCGAGHGTPGSLCERHGKLIPEA